MLSLSYELQTLQKPGSSQVEEVTVRHDIHQKARVKLTVPVRSAMRSTHRSDKGVTAADTRVAPPLPPARLPPVLHEAIEQFIDTQVATTGTRDWRIEVADELQNAVDTLWLTQKVHHVVVPVQAAARGFVQRCKCVVSGDARAQRSPRPIDLCLLCLWC